MDEKDIRWKSDKMVGADDGSANPPWWLTKTHEYHLAKLPHQSPQQMVMFKDKFVSADTDQSPQIHLDLEQTVTEYYSFPRSRY
jgi:hypothetical protein